MPRANRVKHCGKSTGVSVRDTRGFTRSDRRPRSYREPIVLCYLEHMTCRQAARHLRWSESTTHGRWHGRGICYVPASFDVESRQLVRPWPPRPLPVVRQRGLAGDASGGSSIREAI